MHIEQLLVQNYRLFKPASVKDLPGMAVFVGANGSGKSTLFDIFVFQRDSLKDSVSVALARRSASPSTSPPTAKT